MVPRDALVLSVSERGEILSVLFRKELGYVLAQVVPCPGKGLGQRGNVHLHFRRREGEPLVHIDFGIVGMVDDEQRNMVEEVRFPEFRRDAQVVPGGRAVFSRAGGQLFSAYPNPVLGGHDARRFLRVDLEPQRRTPDEIGDEIHAFPVPCEEPRARPLEALLRQHDFPGKQIEFGLYAAVGPHDAGHVRHGVGTQSEMHEGPFDHLFLERQSGPYFYLAPDSERIDALIAHRFGGAQMHLLPVVGFAAFVFQPGGRARFGKSDQVQAPVGGQVRDGEDMFGEGVSRRMQDAARMRFVRVPQPDAGARRGGRRQVQPAVVIQVRDEKLRGAGRYVRRHIFPAGDFFRKPCGACVFAVGRKPQNRSVRPQRRQIDRRVAVQVRRPDGEDAFRFGHGLLPREKPAAPVGEKAQRSVCVHERGVRVSVAVEIPPGKVPQRVDFPEKVQRRERSVAVVAQGEGRAFDAGRHKVHVALQVEVRGPDVRQRSGQNLCGQSELRSGLRKGPRAVLPEQAQAARADQRKVHRKVVVVIDAGYGLRSVLVAAGPFEQLSVREMYPVSVGKGQRDAGGVRCLLAFVRAGRAAARRSKHRHAAPEVVLRVQRLRGERQLFVAGRDGGGRFGQPQKARHQVADLFGGRLDGAQVLSVRGNPQQHVPQKSDVGRRRRKVGRVGAGCGGDGGCQLFQSLFRPGRGQGFDMRQRMPQRFAVAGTRRRSGAPDEGGPVVRMHAQQRVKQRRGFVVAPGFRKVLGQRIQRLRVRRIQRRGLLQAPGRFRTVALTLLEQAKQQADHAIFRRKRFCFLQVFRGQRIVVPPHGEQPQVNPGRGFSRRQFRYPKEIFFALPVDARLDSRQARIERRNRLAIGFGIRFRERRSAARPKVRGQQNC